MSTEPLAKLNLVELDFVVNENAPSQADPGHVKAGATIAGVSFTDSAGVNKTMLDSSNAGGYGLSAPVAAFPQVVNSNTFALSVANKGIFNLTGDVPGRLITSIIGGTNGQLIVLHFGDGNVGITPAAAKLAGNINFVGANSDQLILSYNGIEWAEASRQQQSGLNGVLGAQTPQAANVTNLIASGNITSPTADFGFIHLGIFVIPSLPNIDLAIVLTEPSDIYRHTPTQDELITTSLVPPGCGVCFVITTSGTTSYTLTFGIGFKTTGTLSTGTVSGKVFTICFVSDSINFNEKSRTTAM